MIKTYVYYAKMPSYIGDRELYPQQRMTEIFRCRNEKTKREKYWVWVLLEKALADAFNTDITNLQFTKLPNNKWISDKCDFSLSHTDTVLAVAVSNSAVGVDIEGIKALRSGIEGKILTEREISQLSGMTLAEREEYILEKWCEKEAIFKRGNSDALLPRTIETTDYKTEKIRVTLSDKEYLIAVCADGDVVLREIEL